MTTKAPAIADQTELDIIGALVFSPQACAWFEDMYIGFEVFTDPRAAAIATWAIKRHCAGAPPLIREALAKESAEAESLAATLGFHAALVEARNPLPHDENQEHMRRLQDAIRRLAPRWLPRALHEIADYYAACAREHKEPQGAIEHLDKVVLFIRGELE